MEEVLKWLRREMDGKESVLIAIDGNCASGKTTLAAYLAENLNGNVLHMDDFFLRPEQRTSERYAEAGGNVDYERFWEEVLQPLKAGKPFFYRPFDCHTMKLAEPIHVAPGRVNIVEGTYSQHPYFGDSYDLKIFLTVPPELQRQRIMQRPAFLHHRFFEEWIPMEWQYFETFHIPEHANLLTQL